MKTENLNFGGRNLPSYLGYGILDEKSITFKNDVLFANYVFECDGSLVHQVAWEKNRCKFDTFDHGKPLRQSCYPDLEKVLLNEYSFLSLDRDDCYQFLSREICGLGNIYVHHPKRDEKSTSINFFPAGKLFLFSLPLLERNSPYLNFLKRPLKHASFFRERNGVLLLETNDSKIIAKPIIIADFIVALAYLTSAARDFVSSNIISNEKHLRLMVNESYDVESGFMQVFTGNDVYPHFAICSKEHPKEKYAALEEMFCINVAELIKK